MTDSLFAKWQQLVPQKCYGELPLTSAIVEFRERYEQALQSNSLESFLEENKDFFVYISRADTKTASAFDERSKKILRNHSSDNLDKIQARLLEFEKELEQNTISQFFKQEYLLKLEEEKRFIKQAKTLGTPEFTKLQLNPKQWADLIDFKNSDLVVKLMYEDEAREVLAATKNKREKEHVTTFQALKSWNLSPTEAKYMGSINGNTNSLSAEQAKRLLEILCNRLSIHGIWNVDIVSTTKAVAVDAKSKKILFPKSRTLTGDEVLQVPAHEFMHAVRSENGSRQAFRLLQEGVTDYLSSEEGSAIIAEGIFETTSNYRKQKLYAARYLTASMMIKAQNVDGTIQPIYNPQEIYDELITFGLDQEDVAETVWRSVRGTSLEHTGLLLEIDSKQVPIAECFLKDTAYFSGIIQISSWISTYKATTTLESLDTLGIGKVRIDMLDETSPWADVLATKNMIQYSQLLTPKVIS